MGKIRQDYSDIIGHQFGGLIILRVLPRVKIDKKTEPAVCVVRCTWCGDEKIMQLRSAKSGRNKSCGCLNGHKVRKSNPCKEGSTAYIVDKLKAEYVCRYAAGSGCLRQEVAHLCCFECDKKAHCGLACKNTPDKCGAKKRKKRR